jgi:succinylarginine dihydrolase
MQHVEMNFDGLVGPTHNYAGLSYGNVASLNNAKGVSQPKQAALQGLFKMKTLADLGMHQGVLAPQARPDLSVLRRLGFSGTDAQVLNKAAKSDPVILSACYSASSMWTANAATVSPSADTTDGKVHFTPANLTNKFHRSIEPEVTGRILRATFNDPNVFVHHQHLPENDHFGDEGAANHTRFCSSYDQSGVEFFVYGRHAFDANQPAPKKFPARQTFEASQAVARLHGLTEDNTVFALQNPDVIDQGVFHNDVISVGNQNVLFYHQQAFAQTESVLDEIQRKMGQTQMHFIQVPTEQVTINDAVRSYLFNTQIITLPNGEMTIIAPMECQENPAVYQYLNDLVQQSTPIKHVQYIDVKQSMQNGGGPACLRLRVALKKHEQAAINQHTRLTDAKFIELNQWVEKHYRDELAIADLADPSLLLESQSALDELTQILHLGSVYPFQLG